MFQTLISSVSSAFGRMLQVLHPDVLKVNRMLHPPSRFLLPHLGVSSPFRPSFLDAGDVQDGVGPTWTRETARKSSIGTRNEENLFYRTIHQKQI